MSFANPLAFAFLAVALPIIALYLFRIRRRPEDVPSIALWQRLIHETEFTSFLRRLRRLLSLLLQLAIAAAIIFALARPELDLSGIRGRNLAILLDDSASMRAREEGGTRFDLARQKALQIVEERSVLDEVMIVLASSRTQIASPFTRDRRRLAEILEQTGPQNLGTDLGAAYRLAAGLLRGRENPEVVVISDGGAGQVQALIDAAEFPVHYIPVGSATNNVGIVRFRARKNIPLGTDTVHAEVKNASAERRELSMELRVDGETRKVIPLDLEPGAVHRESLDLRLPDGGVLDLALDVDDDLALDDRAWAVVQPQEPQRVLVVTPEGREFFLQAACESMDEVVDLGTSRILSPDDYDALPPEDRVADAVIVQDRLPATLPERGNFLFIHVSGEDVPFRLGPEEALPSIQDWDEMHPINQMVSWRDLELPKARPVKGAGESALVESHGGALVAARRDGDRRLVYVGFDVVEADFPFRLAFPVLLRNILAWFHEEESRLFEDVYAPGEGIAPLRPLPGGVEEVRITYRGADGATVSRVLPVRGGMFHFDETGTTGPYRVQAVGAAGEGGDGPGGLDFLTCVTLGDEAESTIAVVEERDEGRIEEASFLLHREFWRGFAVFALVLVLLEWALFQRRFTD